MEGDDWSEFLVFLRKVSAEIGVLFYFIKLPVSRDLSCPLPHPRGV